MSAASFALSGPIMKSLTNAGWTPTGVLAVRICGAALLLALLTVAIERRLPRITRRGVAALVLYGILGVAVVQLGFVCALRTLSVGVTLMIQFLAPVLVIAWAWLVEHRAPGRFTVAGCALALAGAAVIVNPLSGARLDLAGLAWAFLSTGGLAGLFILSRPAAGERSAVAFGALGMAVGAVVIVLLGASGLLPMAVGSAEVRLGSLWLPEYLPVLLLVVVATALPYVTAIAAVARVGASIASVVLLAEVIFGAIAAWILLGERITVAQVIGGVVLLVGIAMVDLDADQRPPHAGPG